MKTESLQLLTPLGYLFFNCRTLNKSLLGIQPDKFIKKNSSTISYWKFDDCVIEFKCFYLVPKLPPEMAVDECICGIWNVRALKEQEIAFDAYLDSKEQLSIWAEPGEGVIAQSFSKNQHKISIGTEDEEYLRQRATVQKGLPQHFMHEINASAIHYLPNGISVTLPKLSKNEEVQVQFLVAWTSNATQGISTLYAVDQPFDRIMEQSRISR